eukprot:c19649_g2_i1.p1 GENE.c19649_g2_i1~~c19649_g2_i1.p1  ORF type:complete len:361 (+),score=68.18 c19649_g2_i1:144-1226(+)
MAHHNQQQHERLFTQVLEHLMILQPTGQNQSSLTALAIEPFAALVTCCVFWKGDIFHRGRFWRISVVCLLLKLTQILLGSQAQVSDTNSSSESSIPKEHSQLSSGQLPWLAKEVAHLFGLQGAPSGAYLMFHLLPFVRQVALLLHVLNHVVGAPAQSLNLHDANSPQEMFDAVCEYLVVPDCRRILESCSNVLRRWTQLTPASNSNRLWLHRSWGFKKFEIAELERDFHTLFQTVKTSVQCANCNKTPQSGAICVLCGALVCVKDSCCRLGSWGECQQHSEVCGAGNCAFVLVNQSQTLGFHRGRAFLWPSLYRDAYGESDETFGRGCPLTLNKQQVDKLTKVLRRNTFYTANMQPSYDL